MSSRFLSFALLATVLATPFDLNARDDECTPCNPQGATGTNPPAIGPDLKSLYIDLLASVKDIHFRKREAESMIARADGFCCKLDCVNVQNLNIPMCYDKFTTQYQFPDASYGSLTTGDYTQGGTVVNLVIGNYTKSGQTSNIYSGDPSAKPNMETLSIPPQWTSAGVGSAIPATELGSVISQTTITTSGPAQTNAATTTLTAVNSQNTTAVTAASSLTAVSSQNTVAATAASSSSTAAAGHMSVDSVVSCWGTSLFSALMYAIYAL
ncbi:hypothetical protein K504DRAFT_465518 [Pleomassaria siparia CBS 279.74]|uniref:Uncharacterized protein n=1 Tax=Pleomassaria siparia CBS 279.74 TaxID=1314801 RepID=A0A6G1KH96_9PLEO|nr:hypothetical protein K504DRAFT_465518 [Pleomassaria siparia CBS 279.74]